MDPQHSNSQDITVRLSFYAEVNYVQYLLYDGYIIDKTTEGVKNRIMSLFLQHKDVLISTGGNCFSRYKNGRLVIWVSEDYPVFYIGVPTIMSVNESLHKKISWTRPISSVVYPHHIILCVLLKSYRQYYSRNVKYCNVKIDDSFIYLDVENKCDEGEFNLINIQDNTSQKYMVMSFEVIEENKITWYRLETDNYITGNFTPEDIHVHDADNGIWKPLLYRKPQCGIDPKTLHTPM